MTSLRTKIFIEQSVDCSSQQQSSRSDIWDAGISTIASPAQITLTSMYILYVTLEEISNYGHLSEWSVVSGIEIFWFIPWCHLHTLATYQWYSELPWLNESLSYWKPSTGLSPADNSQCDENPVHHLRLTVLCNYCKSTSDQWVDLEDYLHMSKMS